MSSATATHPGRAKGFLYALAGMLFVSCNYVTAKYCLHDPTGVYGHDGFQRPETFALIWMGSSSVYAFVFVLLTGKARALILSRQALVWMVLLGLANTGAQLLMWQGLARLDPSFAAFLGRFYPVMAILLGVVLLKERIRALEWVAIGVMIAGGAVSTMSPTWQGELLGVFFMVAGSLSCALQLPIAKHRVNEIHTSVLSFYRVAVAAVAVCLWAAGTGTLDFSGGELRHWAVACFGAFLGPFLSYVFTFLAYRYWDMSRASILLTLQPLIVMPLAYAVFGKLPTGVKLLGGFIILGGAFWLAWMHRQPQARANDEVPNDE